jgi:hypothetical protein
VLRRRGSTPSPDGSAQGRHAATYSTKPSEFRCQLWCQLRGLKGFIGGFTLNLFSKLLIPHVALPGSNPSVIHR